MSHGVGVLSAPDMNQQGVHIETDLGGNRHGKHLGADKDCAPQAPNHGLQRCA